MDDKRRFFQTFVAFITAVHQVTYEFTKDVIPEDITPLQYNMLQYISVSQPVTLSQISECQHMSMPNASRELKKLTEKQLCEKYSASEDRRKIYIRLTPQGEAMMAGAFEQIEARLMQRMQGIGGDEQEEIKHALDILLSKVFIPGGTK